MALTLKDCIDPWKGSDKCLIIEGQLAISDLNRLMAISVKSEIDLKKLSAKLVFSRNEDHAAVVKGAIKGTIDLECQRCLKAVNVPVESEFTLKFIRSTSDFSVVSDDEFYEVNDDNVCLTDIIEDEILLLLPQVVMHSSPACVIETKFGDEITVEDEKENPFSILASLKK